MNIGKALGVLIYKQAIAESDPIKATDAGPMGGNKAEAVTPKGPQLGGAGNHGNMFENMSTVKGDSPFAAGSTPKTNFDKTMKLNR